MPRMADGRDMPHAAFVPPGLGVLATGEPSFPDQGADQGLSRGAIGQPGRDPEATPLAPTQVAGMFVLPRAPVARPASRRLLRGAGQQALAASMRAAWANFAASGSPATAAGPWPSFGGANSARMLSLVPPRPQIETDFAARHHCAFWAAG